MKGALTDQHKTAARILASGGTNVKAAAAAGVCERTIQKWRKDPDFAAEAYIDALATVRTARVSALPPLVTLLTEAVDYGVRVLCETMKDEDLSAPARQNLAALVKALTEIAELERKDIAPAAVKAAKNLNPKDVPAEPAEPASPEELAEIGRNLLGDPVEPPRSVRLTQTEDESGETE